MHTCKQSYSIKIMFRFFLLVTLAASGFAKSDSVETLSKDIILCKYDYGLFVSSSLILPQASSANNWKHYILGGARLDLPTHNPNLHLHITAEVGQIDMKDNTVQNIETMHSSVTISYFLPLPKIQPLYVRPFAGFANMTICPWEFKLKDVLQHPTRYCESEMGLVGGVELCYRYNRLFVALPISGYYILSDPQRFTTANLSILLGVVF